MGICGSSSSQEYVNPLEVDLSHFEVERIIGEGGFGKVKAVRKITNAGGDKDVWYAMKQMSKEVALKRKMTDEFFMERSMIAQVKHEFLCNGQYCFQDENYCYICLDLALGGNIKYHMMKTKTEAPELGTAFTIPEPLAVFYFAQVRAGTSGRGGGEGTGGAGWDGGGCVGGSLLDGGMGSAREGWDAKCTTRGRGGGG